MFVYIRELGKVSPPVLIFQTAVKFQGHGHELLYSVSRIRIHLNTVKKDILLGNLRTSGVLEKKVQDFSKNLALGFKMLQLTPNLVIAPIVNSQPTQ